MKDDKSNVAGIIRNIVGKIVGKGWLVICYRVGKIVGKGWLLFVLRFNATLTANVIS